MICRIAFAEELPRLLRRPVDAVWIVPGQVLLTANSRSGSLSVVDLDAKSVIHEAVIGGQPVGLLWLGENRLAVIDGESNQLRLLNVKRAPWSVAVVAAWPVLRARWLPDKSPAEA